MVKKGWQVAPYRGTQMSDNMKERQFVRLWYGITPDVMKASKADWEMVTEILEGSEGEGKGFVDSARRIDDDEYLRHVKSKTELSKQADVEDKVYDFLDRLVSLGIATVNNMDIYIFKHNRSKSLGFRQKMMECVRPKGKKMNYKNCKKYWLGILQKEIKDMEQY